MKGMCNCSTCSTTKQRDPAPHPVNMASPSRFTTHASCGKCSTHTLPEKPLMETLIGPKHLPWTLATQSTWAQVQHLIFSRGFAKLACTWTSETRDRVRRTPATSADGRGNPPVSIRWRSAARVSCHAARARSGEGR